MTHIPLLIATLTLVQCFGPVTLGPAVSKTTTTAAPSGDIHGLPADPYAGLPTKFGDEDDVIHLKQPPLLVVPPVAKASTQHQLFDRKKPAAPYTGEDEFYDEDDDGEDYAVEEGEVSREGSEHDEDEYGSSKQSGSRHEDGELGPSLDGFGTALDGGGSGGQVGDEAPMFLSEPQSALIVRGRAAMLKCKAAHAIQVKI